MNEPERILVIRLKSIGDVIFTLPAVHLIRDNFPGAHLAFLTSRENTTLVEGFPSVDEIIGLDRGIFRAMPWGSSLAHVVEVLRRLRRGRFSLAIDFQGYGETALLTWLTGARRRWGSVYRRSRAWAYTSGVTRDTAMHPAAWNRSLLTRCGLTGTPVRNEFSLPEGALESARGLLVSRGLDPGRPILYLQPFTSSARKNWPLEKYLAVAGVWRGRGVQVLFGGGPADEPSLAPARASGFAVIAGAPRMTDAGVMKLSSLIVGGDTGFLHLAVALGKRVVILMQVAGPGTPGPFGHPEWLIGPRDGGPLAGISEEQVNGAIAAVLDGRPVRGEAVAV